MVTLFFIFQGSAPEGPHSFTFPSVVNKDPNVSTSSPTLVIVWSFFKKQYFEVLDCCFVSREIVFIATKGSHPGESETPVEFRSRPGKHFKYAKSGGAEGRPIFFGFLQRKRSPSQFGPHMDPTCQGQRSIHLPLSV